MRRKELRQYLNDLKSRNIQLLLDDGKLFCEAPSGAMTDADYSVLAENKQKIITYLLAQDRRSVHPKDSVEPESIEAILKTIEAGEQKAGDLSSNLKAEIDHQSNEEPSIQALKHLTSFPGSELRSYWAGVPEAKALQHGICPTCGQETVYRIGDSVFFDTACSIQFEIKDIKKVDTYEERNFF